MKPKKLIFPLVLGCLALTTLFFNNCSNKGFETLSPGKIEVASSVPNDTTANDTPTDTPAPEAPPISAPPVVGEPPVTFIGNMNAYLPKIPTDQCQFKLKVQDPFIGMKFNTKKVCAQGCDYTTVKDAFAKAQPYDEILIEPGIYPGCLTLKASPVIARGVNGLVDIQTTASCGSYRGVMTIFSPQVKLNNFRVAHSVSGGFNFQPVVKYAELSDFWVEDAPGAVSIAQNAGTVILSRFKIKNVGSVLADGHHTSVISSQNENILISYGTMSQMKLGSWGLGSRSTNIEFICNVILRLDKENGHAFHFNISKTARIYKNYINQFRDDKTFFYQGMPATGGSDLLFEENQMLSDVVDADFRGNFGAGGVRVVWKGNKYIGDGLNSLRQGKVDLLSNTFIESREKAGIGPYPALPADWPVDLSKL